MFEKVAALLCLILIQANIWICTNANVVPSILQPLTPSEEYTHHLIVNEDNPKQYQVFWKINKEEIQIEVHCLTTGWVGLGLSPNGGMQGSDIVIGWVNSNKQPQIKDCFASIRGKPTSDPKQDWILLDGAEVDGYTILKYKRKLYTCDDEYDREIISGTTYMIFAWNAEDPLTGNDDWKYHGSQNRLSRTVILLNYKDESLDSQENILPKDTYTHSFRMPNIVILPKQTFYYCDLFQLPDFSETNHLVQYEMIVNPANKHVVHHLLAYECAPGFVPTKPLASECGYVGIPSDVSSNCMTRLFIAWGIGGNYNYTFPRQAGYPFTKAATKRYILIEMHYDNPTLEKGRVDDSGVKLYFTKTLRQHDLGLMQLGMDGPYALQIPPRSDITFSSTCYPECTTKFFPPDGITVVSGLLHTHLAGRKVRTSLARDGQVIKHIFDDPNYDFNYQFIMDIEPIKLYKGDALITKCTYSSHDRTKFTFFGTSTYEEMCYDFVYYYPRIPEFASCSSLPTKDAIYNFYSELMRDGVVPTATLTASTPISTIMGYLNSLNVTKEVTERFTKFFDSGFNKSFFCGDRTFGTNGYLSNSNAPHYNPKELVPPIRQC